MHSSGIDVLFKAYHSVPSISSSMLLPSMPQPLMCWHAGVSNSSSLTTRLSIIPFPWGPHWRRIQQWRRLHKASRAEEISTDTNSSVPLPGAPAPSCPPSTTRAEKFVSSSNQSPAVFPAVEGPTCSGTISKTTQLQSIVLHPQPSQPR